MRLHCHRGTFRWKWVVSGPHVWWDRNIARRNGRSKRSLAFAPEGVLITYPKLLKSLYLFFQTFFEFFRTLILRGRHPSS